MDLVIKIRWNCGTERYVTGFAGQDSVSWKQLGFLNMRIDNG